MSCPEIRHGDFPRAVGDVRWNLRREPPLVRMIAFFILLVICIVLYGYLLIYRVIRMTMEPTVSVESFKKTLGGQYERVKVNGEGCIAEQGLN